MVPLISIGYRMITDIGKKVPTTVNGSVDTSFAGNKPDVYYIILDAYGRSDVLKDKVGYDNAGFIYFLKNKGFYVANCSLSNHNHTQLSVATSLNMNYLPQLPVTNFVRMGNVIKNSELRSRLNNLGYQTVAFETGYNFTEIEDADIYFRASEGHQTAGRWFGFVE